MGRKSKSSQRKRDAETLSQGAKVVDACYSKGLEKQLEFIKTTDGLSKKDREKLTQGAKWIDAFSKTMVETEAPAPASAVPPPGSGDDQAVCSVAPSREPPTPENPGKALEHGGVGPEGRAADQKQADTDERRRRKKWLFPTSLAFLALGPNTSIRQTWANSAPNSSKRETPKICAGLSTGCMLLGRRIGFPRPTKSRTTGR